MQSRPPFDEARHGMASLALTPSVPARAGVTEHTRHRCGCCEQCNKRSWPGIFDQPESSIEGHLLHRHLRSYGAIAWFLQSTIRSSLKRPVLYRPPSTSFLIPGYLKQEAFLEAWHQINHTSRSSKSDSSSAQSTAGRLPKISACVRPGQLAQAGPGLPVLHRP